MKMLLNSKRCDGSGVAALWGEPPGNLASVLLEVINIEHTAAVTHSVLPITY